MPSDVLRAAVCGQMGEVPWLAREQRQRLVLVPIPRRRKSCGFSHRVFTLAITRDARDRNSETKKASTAESIGSIIGNLLTTE
jgi:hypothetical protein